MSFYFVTVLTTKPPDLNYLQFETIEYCTDDKVKNMNKTINADIAILQKSDRASMIKIRDKSETPLSGDEVRLYIDHLEKGIERLQLMNQELELAKNEATNSAVEKFAERYQKIITDLIKAKEQAEESDRLKSSFLANMSHEIRTPMTGILGFTELLKEPNLSVKEQLEFIRIIETSGARMLSIINDIMSISKVESGQMEVYISGTNINAQIDFLYTFFKPETEQKGLQLMINKTLSSKEATIKTDKEKIYSILTNLVKNAIKFTHTGFIEFGYELKNKCLEFYVKDTGPGIREEQKHYIFERFRQGSESLKRKYEGAGLGLTISKAFVEMLGGNIRVESKIGEGSVFYFTIPYIVQREENAPIKSLVPNEKSEYQIKKLKILIAEDNQISAILLDKVIGNFSKEILNVNNGIEAVEVCFSNPDIDLILMDIQMPLMDGYEATRLIRKFNTEVVIIAQSAFALTGDQEMAIASGCNNYISKPIQKKHLHDLILEYFRQQ